MQIYPHIVFPPATLPPGVSGTVGKTPYGRVIPTKLIVALREVYFMRPELTRLLKLEGQQQVRSLFRTLLLGHFLASEPLTL